VVVGEGWHEGVIGIVASRLVERFNRPVVVIAGSDGDWKGSGRSVSAFDLHAGLGEQFVRGIHRGGAGADQDERGEGFRLGADGGTKQRSKLHPRRQ